LPDIVRLQALREFSEVSEDWPLDYLPVHGTEEETIVLAAAISPRKLAAYESLLTAGDFKPRAFVLRPTATSTLVSQLDDTMRPKVELCVDDLDTECEMSVLREGSPILIRTVQVPRSETYDRATFLAQEIRRTIVAAHNQLSGEAVQRVVMFGVADDGTAEIGLQLQDRVKMPVRVLNPFALSSLQRKSLPTELQKPRQFAATIGLLVSQSISNPQLIDFRNPRKVTPPKSRKKAILTASTGIGAVVLAAIAMYLWHLAALDATARDLQRKLQAQTKLVEAAEQRIAEVTAIQQWARSDINWLEEMRDISTKMPAADRAKFSRWQADVLSNGDGQIILEGVVDDQGTIGLVDEALRSQRRRVQGAGGEFEGREPGYPWRFKQAVTIPTNVQPSPSNSASPRTSARRGPGAR
jgi:hypothetical protein